MICHVSNFVLIKLRMTSCKAVGLMENALKKAETIMNRIN